MWILWPNRKTMYKMTSDVSLLSLGELSTCWDFKERNPPFFSSIKWPRSDVSLFSLIELSSYVEFFEERHPLFFASQTLKLSTICILLCMSGAGQIYKFSSKFSWLIPRYYLSIWFSNWTVKIYFCLNYFV